MRSSCDAKTAVFESGILKRVPERQAAGRVCETDAAVLVWDDSAACVGKLGDDLALGYT